ncbi:MAG: hypothetical protein KDB47_00680, partial [Mycobacterium sp.]|nr:hypothetical protein [Mycobacterium sp.]
MAALAWPTATAGRDILSASAAVGETAMATPASGPSGTAVTRAAVGASATGAASILSFFFGDGTADSPNGGILIGNGFSYDA